MLPYFGICLGMQVAVIEFARHAAGIADADSGEFNEICKHKVIDFMPGQSDDIDKGGTLRLGACPVRDYARHNHGALLRNAARFPSATATATSSTTIIALPLTDAGLTLSGLSARRTAGRDRGAVGPGVLRRRAVSSGVQIAPEQGASAVPRLHRRSLGRGKKTIRISTQF